MKTPKNWNAEQIKSVLAHYENQTEDEAVAEDELRFSSLSETVMEIPLELVPAVRELIARRRAS
jgi:hypothetical protein